MRVWYDPGFSLYSRFSPAGASVKTYATSAFAWAVENGIINGMDGYLAPSATPTRTQIAAILMRFAQC